MRTVKLACGCCLPLVVETDPSDDLYCLAHGQWTRRADAEETDGSRVDPLPGDEPRVVDTKYL